MPQESSESASAMVKLACRGDHAVLVIDQPAKRNALSMPVMSELVRHIKRLTSSKTARSIVITGAGDKVFASGADLTELPDALKSPTSAQSYDAQASELYIAIRTAPIPVIARMNGHAIGAGLLLALACDFRVAAKHIKVGLPSGRIGLMLSETEHRILASTLSNKVSKLLTLTGRIYQADAAMDLGLVDHVVPGSELDSVVAAFEDDIAKCAPYALGATKSILNAMFYSDPALAQKVQDAYTTIYSSADLREGLSAALEKRSPVFSWK